MNKMFYQKYLKRKRIIEKAKNLFAKNTLP